MKIRNILIGALAGMAIFSMPVCAEENASIDYGTYFEPGTEVHIEYPESMNLTIRLNDADGNRIFYMGMVADYIYINEEVNVYAVPNTSTSSCGTLLNGAKVFRAAYNKYGWNIVQLSGVNYFVYTKDMDLNPVEGVEYTEMDQPYVATLTYSSSSYSYSSSYVGGDSGISAKEWIAQRESGGNYNAVSPSGKYIGRYQLSADKLNGDYSIENQEATADAYVYSTYGSWEAAQAFWQANGWY